VTILRRAAGPLRGADLATRLRVSRQVVVGDVAILRAEGAPVVGSPQGYRLLEPLGADGQAGTAVLAVKHDRRRTRTELLALVDHGITVLDVVVEHPLYGELRANLMLSSREDVERFLESLQDGKAELLSALTGGVHLHTVRAPSPALLERARRALSDAGILLSP